MCSAPVLQVVIIGSSVRGDLANRQLVPGRSTIDILNLLTAAQATAGRRVLPDHPMKPAAFDHVVAESIEAAVTALAAADGEAKIIAGGQSLVPMLNFRLLRPSILVDINRIPDLAYIEEHDDTVAIGALTRHHRLETSQVIAKHLPVITEAMRH